MSVQLIAEVDDIFVEPEEGACCGLVRESLGGPYPEPRQLAADRKSTSGPNVDIFPLSSGMNFDERLFWEPEVLKEISEQA